MSKHDYPVVWSDLLHCWVMAPDTTSATPVIVRWYIGGATEFGTTRALAAPEPLPFFLDPAQIEALTPEIDWDKRVGDRIRHFIEMGRLARLT